MHTAKNLVAAAGSLLLLSSLASLAGCKATNETPITQTEAHDAVDETTASTQASALTSSSIEVATSFTIGEAVSDAAADIKTFITTELPCADVSVANATVTIQYGAKAGNCTYNGQTFTGSHSITVSENDMSEVIVDHTWTNLSNGIVKLNGTAHVTWDGTQKFRKVSHDFTWTRLSDGITGHGTGDKTQTPLSGGLAEGIQVDGTHTWTGPSGTWELTISGVQLRWADPLPQAGNYTLQTPDDHSLELAFNRVDGATIQVTLESGSRSFSFDVNSTGGVADQ